MLGMLPKLPRAFYVSIGVAAIVWIVYALLDGPAYFIGRFGGA